MAMQTPSLSGGNVANASNNRTRRIKEQHNLLHFNFVPFYLIRMYFMMNNKEKHHFWKVDKCLFHFHVQVLLRALIEMLNCCVIAPPDPLNDQMGGTDIDGK